MSSGSASLGGGCGPAPAQLVHFTAPDGIRLAARVGGSGAGPPLVLLHGFTGSSHAWGGSLLGDLCRLHRRVVALDLVGHGDSEPCTDPARYRIDLVLADVVAAQDRFVGEAAVWLGYSMGGRVALAAAVRGAASMTGLILESASPGLAEARERRRRVVADEAWARLLDEHGVDAFVDQWISQPLFQTQRQLPAEARLREQDRRRGQDARALAACLRGLGTGAQPSFWDNLPNIDTPCLLVTGALDRKFHDLGRSMADLLPRARHVSIPDAGHAVHLERPEAWKSAVCTFATPEAGGGL